MAATHAIGNEKGSITVVIQKQFSTSLVIKMTPRNICIFATVFWVCFFHICLPNFILVNHPLRNEMTKNSMKGWVSFILEK